MLCHCEELVTSYIGKDKRSYFKCRLNRCRFYALGPLEVEGYDKPSLSLIKQICFPKSLSSVNHHSPQSTTKSNISINDYAIIRFEAVSDASQESILSLGFTVHTKSNRVDVSQILRDKNKFKAQWIQSREIYIFPTSVYEDFLTSVKSLPNVFVFPIPSFFFNSWKILCGKAKTEWHASLQSASCTNLMTSFIDSPLKAICDGEGRLLTNDILENDGMLQQLKPFQQSGVSFIVSHGGRGMIADEMGLGKTIQAIAVAHIYREEWPVLVICPSSLIENWCREWMRFCFLPLSRVCCLRHATDTPTDLHSVVICSYANLKALEISKSDYLKKFNVVLVDESHYIKNPEAQRTKQVLALCKVAKRVVLLSGTPAMSRPFELYSQMLAIHSNILPSLKQFGSRYCNAFVGSYGVDYSGHSYSEELKVLLKHFMIRRVKKDVLGQLPKKIRELLYIHVTEKERKALEPNLAQLRVAASNSQFRGISSGGRLSEDNMSVGDTSELLSNARIPNVFELKLATARSKIPAIQEYLKDQLSLSSSEETSKMLIFAHHSCMIEALCATLTNFKGKQATDFICITGQTPGPQREVLAERFRAKDSCRFAILSMLASGVGHNFTCSNTVVFTELHWNPSVHLQCEDRVHRMGQSSSCVIRYLLAEGTSDSIIWPLLQEKLNVTSAVLNDATDKSAPVTLETNSHKAKIHRFDAENERNCGSRATSNHTSWAIEQRTLFDTWGNHHTSAKKSLVEVERNIANDTCFPSRAPNSPSLGMRISPISNITPSNVKRSVQRTLDNDFINKIHVSENAENNMQASDTPLSSCLSQRQSEGHGTEIIVVDHGVKLSEKICRAIIPAASTSMGLKSSLDSLCSDSPAPKTPTNMTKSVGSSLMQLSNKEQIKNYQQQRTLFSVIAKKSTT